MDYSEHALKSRLEYYTNTMESFAQRKEGNAQLLQGFANECEIFRKQVENYSTTQEEKDRAKLILLKMNEFLSFATKQIEKTNKK
jgi:hypothetical protein